MIKRTKKAIGLAAFGLAGALLLSGCGNESSSGDGKKDTGSNEQTYQVGISQYVEHPSLDAATKGFKEGFKGRKITLSMTNKMQIMTKITFNRLQIILPVMESI